MYAPTVIATVAPFRSFFLAGGVWEITTASLVDYLVMMKRSEIEAHAKAADASAWEMAEYFELF